MKFHLLLACVLLVGFALTETLAEDCYWTTCIWSVSFCKEGYVQKGEKFCHSFPTEGCSCQKTNNPSERYICFKVYKTGLNYGFSISLTDFVPTLLDMKVLALIFAVFCAFFAFSEATKCADESENCKYLKPFCNDFKYEDMLAVKCAATCNKC
ncbi:hypothetical protein QR680_014440 [Steinernema hermaphroditum]|uniref:ShKT domain-containing protein n=1 Tax=Steinernema hermaphroditum TaxID=289476 RepID=A0AA39IBH3_9BILA|nr:hypothetical protein QR680_014440 [Steinernema hermaphroditum]